MNDDDSIRFEWDEANEAYAFKHGLSALFVAAVADEEPRFFRNREGRTGTHMMIGPNPEDRGRFWTVILIDRGDYLWRPINGWLSSPLEVDLYRNQGVR